MMYNLLAEMARAGITQQKLADKVGVNVKTINSWLYERTSPPLDYAVRVKSAIGTTEPLERLFMSFK